jgi:protein phosphatase
MAKTEEIAPGSEESTLDHVRPTASKRPSVQITFGASSHVGKVRPNNEDQYLVARLCKSLQVLHTGLPRPDRVRTSNDEAYIMLVADGMGGAAAGERASALVVEGVETYLLETIKWFFYPDERDDKSRLRDIRLGLEWLDRMVFQEGQSDRSLAGMGTTLTSARSLADEVIIVHVGDSRAYLFRDSGLTQITRDHTLAQMMLDVGMLRPEEAEKHAGRNIMTNVLGGPEPGVSGDVHRIHVVDGDRLLLCTDGLTRLINDDQITAILSQNADPQEACEALIDSALKAGGPDNITVIVASYAVAMD